MKRYIVIATKAICAAQGQKLSKGTIKDESYFADGQIAELKGRGMIAEYKVPEVAAVRENLGPDMTGTTDKTDTAAPTGKSYSKMNLTELKDSCVDKGIDFSNEATKKDLITLLRA